MQYTHSIPVWNKFGEAVTFGAKRNIGVRKVGKNTRYGEASGTLRRSLSFRLDEQTLTLDFFANPPADRYAEFMNYGVNGTEVNHGSVYSFGSKQPPRKSILEWMRVKPVRLRNPQTGEFIKQTPARMNSAAFLIARSIKKKGIKGIFYWQEGYRTQIDGFIEDIMDAMARDIAEDMLQSMDNLNFE